MSTAKQFNNICKNRVYTNSGNLPLIELITKPVRRVLDVGCGAGANASLIRRRYPDAKIDGITISSTEKVVAEPLFDELFLFDIESSALELFENSKYDVIIFSHVLEHLQNPAQVLAKFTELLELGGQVLIAVPNVLGWRQRIKFLFGKFKYETAGVLDNTHLRFFTYFTTDQYLLADCHGVKVIAKSATGSVPLWWLRRHIFPISWSAGIDKYGCRKLPNFFGDQVLVKAVKL